MSFSGKELIKGEPDASSFPSGGLRATFEARGYTRMGLYITGIRADRMQQAQPCVFQPRSVPTQVRRLTRRRRLLRSMEAINEQSLRLLRLFGNTTSKKVTPFRWTGAGILYRRPREIFTEKRSDLYRTYLIRSNASEGTGDGRSLLSDAIRERIACLHEGRQRGTLEAWRVRQRHSTTRWHRHSMSWLRSTQRQTWQLITTSLSWRH